MGKGCKGSWLSRFWPNKNSTSRGPKVSVGFSSPSQTAGEQFERSERMAAKQYIHIRVYKLAAPENGWVLWNCSGTWRLSWAWLKSIKPRISYYLNDQSSEATQIIRLCWSQDRLNWNGPWLSSNRAHQLWIDPSRMPGVFDQTALERRFPDLKCTKWQRWKNASFSLYYIYIYYYIYIICISPSYYIITWYYISFYIPVFGHHPSLNSWVNHFEPCPNPVANTDGCL